MQGRSPTCYSPVRRSCTPKGLTARLACVKHAASVRPEPGSNSPMMNYGHTSPEGPMRTDKRVTAALRRTVFSQQIPTKNDSTSKTTRKIISCQKYHPPTKTIHPKRINRRERRQLALTFGTLLSSQGTNAPPVPDPFGLFSRRLLNLPDPHFGDFAPCAKTIILSPTNHGTQTVRQRLAPLPSETPGARMKLRATRHRVKSGC